MLALSATKTLRWMTSSDGNDVTDPDITVTCSKSSVVQRRSLGDSLKFWNNSQFAPKGRANRDGDVSAQATLLPLSAGAVGGGGGGG